MSEDLLSVQDLKTYFFTSMGIVRAVDGVSIAIKKREAVGLVGESGCGKTTIAYSILRLVPRPGKIVGGKILYGHKNLLELEEDAMRDIRGKEISMVFQDPATFLNPVMKVSYQIAESIKLHQMEKKGPAKRKAIEMLEAVGIPSASEVANYYPHQLSGGMKQRVIIAIALSCNPSLVIADEPTTSLDVTIQAQVLDLIKDLSKRHGTSLLLITHDLGIIADVCDKVYVMYAGKVVESGDVFAIYETHKHPYTTGLLESVLSIDEFKETLVTIDGMVPDLVNPPAGCRFHPRCHESKTICSRQEPPPVEIEPQHWVRCWLYV